MISNKQLLLGFKAIVAAIPLFLLLWLVNQNYVLTSKVTYSYKPGNRSSGVLMLDLLAIVRTADPALRWRILANTFPIKVQIPRLIQAVRLQARLTNAGQSVINLVANQKKELGDRQFLIHSTVLENLEWKRISQDGLTLWQRDKRLQNVSSIVPSTHTKKSVTKTVTVEKPVRQYASIAEFQAHPPALQSVGTVGLGVFSFLRIPDYHPSTNTVSINHTLRGSHEFFVYASNEDVHLKFEKVDLNRVAAPSTMTISLVQLAPFDMAGKPALKTMTIGDDGTTNGHGNIGHPQGVDFRVPNVGPGLYLIRVMTTEDSLLQNIVSEQQYFSAQRIFLAEGPSYTKNAEFTPVPVMVNGSKITIAANHDVGWQGIVINGKKINLTATKVDQVIPLSTPTSFTLPKGDAILTTDGFLSFSGSELLPNQMIDTVPIAAASNFDAFDYVISTYQPHGQNGNALTVDQTFNLKDLQLSGKTGKNLSFRLETPGLLGSDNRVGLQSMTITFIRGPFPWQAILKKIGWSSSSS